MWEASSVSKVLNNFQWAAYGVESVCECACKATNWRTKSSGTKWWKQRCHYYVIYHLPCRLLFNFFVSVCLNSLNQCSCVEHQSWINAISKACAVSIEKAHTNTHSQSAARNKGNRHINWYVINICCQFIAYRNAWAQNRILWFVRFG